MSSGEATTRRQTASDVIIEALDLFWFRGQPALGLALLRLIDDWRQDQAMMARTGEDGAV